jgi:hypothetical protein
LANLIQLSYPVDRLAEGVEVVKGQAVAHGARLLRGILSALVRMTRDGGTAATFLELSGLDVEQLRER